MYSILRSLLLEGNHSCNYFQMTTKKGRKGRDTDSMFADAEEFGHILAENADDITDTTSMKAVGNRDIAFGLINVSTLLNIDLARIRH